MPKFVSHTLMLVPERPSEILRTQNPSEGRDAAADFIGTYGGEAELKATGKKVRIRVRGRK